MIVAKMGPEMGGHAGGGVVAWMLLSGLFTLAMLVLVVVLIIWLIRNMSAGQQRDSAMEELRRRYASGAIDQEEFRTRKADLRLR